MGNGIMNHENHTGNDMGETPSDRSFGYTFSVLMLVVALLPLFYGGRIRFWALMASCALILVTWVKPSLLSGLNRRWFSLGRLLHKLVNPVVLAILFFMVITPFAVVMRRFRSHLPFSLGIRPDLKSYWIERDPEAARKMDMSRQY